MSEHYTTGTETALAWCNHCHRITKHAVSGHKLQRCMEHDAPQLTHEQQKRAERRRRELQQPRLFQ